MKGLMLSLNCLLFSLSPFSSLFFFFFSFSRSGRQRRVSFGESSKRTGKKIRKAENRGKHYRITK